MVLASAMLVLAGVRAASAANLVVNPDFSAGDTGFSSSYFPAPGPGGPGAFGDCTAEGVYRVLTDASTCHRLWDNAGDHTSGSGNFMAINGASVPGVAVWQQSIPSLASGTQYFFSAWVTSVYADNPALLNFSINGTPIGGTFAASPTTGEWLQFFATWNSGAATSASIAIVNQNTIANGNDFGLDDISLDTAVPDGTDTTPVPEPATISLLGAGLAAVVARARARRRR